MHVLAAYSLNILPSRTRDCQTVRTLRILILVTRASAAMESSNNSVAKGQAGTARPQALFVGVADAHYMGSQRSQSAARGASVAGRMQRACLGRGAGLSAQPKPLISSVF